MPAMSIIKRTTQCWGLQLPVPEVLRPPGGVSQTQPTAAGINAGGYRPQWITESGRHFVNLEGPGYGCCLSRSEIEHGLKFGIFK